MSGVSIERSTSWRVHENFRTHNPTDAVDNETLLSRKQKALGGHKPSIRPPELIIVIRYCPQAVPVLCDSLWM